MMTTATGKPETLSETQQLTQSAGSVVSRKIWLPKLLYNALPYFYLLAGVAAFFATMYINAWFWVLPHYLIFSAACIHLGISVYRKRNHTSSAISKDTP